MAPQGHRFAFPEGPVEVRQWVRCVVRGHRWDPSPPGEPGYIACARCGMRVKAQQANGV